MSEIIDKTKASNFYELDLFGKPVTGDKVIINKNPDLLNILVIDCGIKKVNGAFSNIMFN